MAETTIFKMVNTECSICNGWGNYIVFSDIDLKPIDRVSCKCLHSIDITGEPIARVILTKRIGGDWADLYYWGGLFVGGDRAGLYELGSGYNVAPCALTLTNFLLWVDRDAMDSFVMANDESARAAFVEYHSGRRVGWLGSV